jgi:Kdo2-lipid IVA lauroyltransferase/acyltransferase
MNRVVLQKNLYTKINKDVFYDMSKIIWSHLRFYTYLWKIYRMQALAFYLVYPLLYLLASLPFRALYKVSDVLYYLFWISGYRKKVVWNNLKNSFPEKSDEEIRKIQKEYFRYLCDITLETFKTLTMTEEEARERCVFIKQDWLDQYYKDKKSIIVVMGHYGNWEWAGPSFTLNNPYQLIVIYRPLSNPYFEKMMSGMRTKFGTRITPAPHTLREMVASRSSITATAFIADQTATPHNAYWMNFLHQDTAVFTGPEKLSIKFDYPVIYMHVKRTQRGYYEVRPELLFADPKSTKSGEITETFTKKLEQEILKDPVIWLWSHKRWKHKRPS